MLMRKPGPTLRYLDPYCGDPEHYALTFSNYVASVAQRRVQLGHGTLSLFCLDRKDEQLANGRTSRCLEF